jgi:hypothetical protein
MKPTYLSNCLCLEVAWGATATVLTPRPRNLSSCTCHQFVPAAASLLASGIAKLRITVNGSATPATER